MILLLKVKPEKLKIFMMRKEKVFRVFDGLPHSLHRNDHPLGGSPRNGLPDGVEKVGGHCARWRVLGSERSQLRGFLAFSMIY